MCKLAMVGWGAMGQELARRLQVDSSVVLTQVIVPSQVQAQAAASCAERVPQARVLTALDLSPASRPDLLVECAGHSALDDHVTAALDAGVPCIVASVGALHDEALLARLTEAAGRGGTQLRLISGAVGAIDALAAARLGGLDQVRYVGRKPPLSWLGTPAEQAFDLHGLTVPQVIFQGSARQAAEQFPQNANVAATVSLAGLGLDRTQVELVADPGVTRNLHRITASGAFGHFDMQLENLPLPGNPKTSALTVGSLEHAVRQRAAPVVL